MKNTHPSFMRPQTPEHNCHRCHRAGHETSKCRATTTALGIPLADDTDSEEELITSTDEYIGAEHNVEQVDWSSDRRRSSSTNECVTCGTKIESAEECLNCSTARTRLTEGIKKLRSRYRHDIKQIKKQK